MHAPLQAVGPQRLHWLAPLLRRAALLSDLQALTSGNIRTLNPALCLVLLAGALDWPRVCCGPCQSPVQLLCTGCAPVLHWLCIGPALAVILTNCAVALHWLWSFPTVQLLCIGCDPYQLCSCPALAVILSNCAVALHWLWSLPTVQLPRIGCDPYQLCSCPALAVILTNCAVALHWVCAGPALAVRWLWPCMGPVLAVRAHMVSAGTRGSRLQGAT